MQDLVEKLQNKLRNFKRQIEEAEEIAALNLAKYRKAQVTKQHDQIHMKKLQHPTLFTSIG